MRIVRLALLMESKYKIAGVPDILNEVKRDLISMYNLYVNSATAKEPYLQMIADAGEIFSKTLIQNIEKVIANIDELAASPMYLFKMLNSILEMINVAKEDPEKKVRNFIHDSIKVKRQSDRNYQELVKSKFERNLYNISIILENNLKTLRAFMPDDYDFKVNKPERKALSKDKLLMFSRTPIAKAHGLDNLDILEKILFHNDLRDRVTTLVNSMDRGNKPNDEEIKKETRSILEAFTNRETNAKQFGEEK